MLRVGLTRGTFVANCACKWLLKRNYAAPKRFFRKTGILYSDGKFEVTLDQRKLKTPGGTTFTVNNEALALAVAAEWDAQKDTIQQSTMHLTALCSTSIDNPNRLSKFDCAQYIAKYLESDTILCQSEENDEFYELQQKEWDPIISWFNQRYNVNVNKSRGFVVSSIAPEVTNIISKHLLSYNFESVLGFMFAVDTLKSVMLTFACVDRFILPDRAVFLSRLEEEYQSRRWGQVEWAHQLNQQDLQTRLSAALLFIHLNSSSNIMKSKFKQANS